MHVLVEPVEVVLVLEQAAAAARGARRSTAGKSGCFEVEEPGRDHTRERQQERQRQRTRAGPSRIGCAACSATCSMAGCFSRSMKIAPWKNSPPSIGPMAK